LSDGEKRGLLAFVLCGLPLTLLWVPGAPLVYVLGAQFVMFIAVGKLAFRIWPDGTGLSGPVRRLAWALSWACLYMAVILLLSLWKFGEYIAMPLPAIALLLTVPRTRRWLSDRLQHWKAPR